MEVCVDQVIDEFCSNAEYLRNILSDENSDTYRFIVKDIDDIEVFKSKVRQSFLNTDVYIRNQHFEISGLEKLPDQLKFYLKMKNDKKATEAILNQKAENILMREIPKKSQSRHSLSFFSSSVVFSEFFRSTLEKYGALQINYLNLPCSIV